MPKVESKFITSSAMLEWQYMQILGELGELQRHASDPTCPCRLSKNLGEHCLAKHSLGLATLGWETAAMDSAHSGALRDLATEAQEKHQGMRDFLCDIKDEPEFVEWSRQWRKKIERMYYRGMCNIKAKQKAISHLHQEASMSEKLKVDCMSVKMEKSAKILPMFGTENDTNKWAVAVDGYFGLFDDKATAEKVYQSIGGYDGADGLAGTGFSSAQILPPHYKPVYIGGWEPSGGIAKLSEYRAIDIADYIRKRPMRQQRNYTEKERTLAGRLADKKFMRDFFGRQESRMGKPDYCTQNNGDCSTCSLVNYGRDCHNNPVGSDQNLTGRLFGGGIDYLELDDWKQEVVRCPNELLIAQKEIKRLREYIYTEHPELRQDVVDLYKTDPLMKTIHMQICPCVFGLLSDKTNKQKLPICKGEQKAQREECIYQMKAANKDNGCKPEGDGSARCPSPFAVCTTSVGCRVGRKAS
jgi:hypothetical protein